MRTIVHISDLHFGRVDPAILTPLVKFIGEVKPDLVAVSGDLTQRARTAEYLAAKEFLGSIPFPQVVVPGNHDVPLHNLVSRFTRSLDRYQRYISADLQPVFADSEVVVVGVNTARALTWKDGRINRRQLEKLRAMLQAAPADRTKIVVTHHPFDLPEGHREDDLVDRAQLAMAAIAHCGADVLLAGHLHVSHTGHSSARYKIAGHSALVVSAGTATSTRGRGETNSFNVLRVKHPFINVERLSWQPERAAFIPSSSEHFRHSPDGWARVPDEMAADIVYDDRTEASPNSP